MGDVGVEVKLCMCESVCKLRLSAAVGDATFAAVDAAVALLLLLLLLLL